MNTRIVTAFLVVVSGLMMGGIHARAAVDSPEALEAARQDAMKLIEAGQRLDAARLLLETLRAIPRDRADLALPAIGAVQLLMFTNEYLMTDKECEALYAGALDEPGNEMDRFLATLMRYMDDAGISQKEATGCARVLLELTQCKHLPVRLGALFTMSSPYYFYGGAAAMGQQARDQIAKEFPGAYLAQEAQRLTLYAARRKGPEAMWEALEPKEEDEAQRKRSLRMKADHVGGALYDALQHAAPAHYDAACVAALAQAAASAPSWAEEYAALTTLEGFHGTPQAPQVRAAAAAAIARNGDARAMFRARVIRLSITRNEADTGAILEDANALLATNPIPVVPERNNYEELKNSIQQAAGRLAELGQKEEAGKLLQRLAARFPNTLLSSKLEAQRAALQEAAPAAQ